MAETVLLDKKERIATITLNRPEARNAINHAMRCELAEAIAEAEATEDVCAVVVRGSGEDAFCAGADIKEFAEPSSLVDEREVRTRRKWTDAIADCAKPTVAAVHGYCLGGGLEIALACDLRIARADAVLGLPEVRLAIIPGAGGTQRLPRVVGAAAALRLILTGQRIDAAEAWRIGLVTEVAEAEEFDAAVESLCDTFRSCGPRALVYAKEAVRAATELPLRDGLRVEGDLSTLLTSTQDRLEGAAAFRERRVPDYRGR